MINRKDCCGEWLKNLQVRAGMKNDLTNPLVGTFDGPGKTGGAHEIKFQSSIVARFLTFQSKKKSAVLMVNGIELIKEPGKIEFRSLIFHLCRLIYAFKVMLGEKLIKKIL